MILYHYTNLSSLIGRAGADAMAAAVASAPDDPVDLADFASAGSILSVGIRPRKLLHVARIPNRRRDPEYGSPACSWPKHWRKHGIGEVPTDGMRRTLRPSSSARHRGSMSTSARSRPTNSRRRTRRGTVPLFRRVSDSAEARAA